LLAVYESIRSPEEDLRRQVPAQLAAEGALDGDGLKGEFPQAGGNVAAAPFAGDHEGFAISGYREHASIIGEYKEK
jgi:hypothetical protein